MILLASTGLDVLIATTGFGVSLAAIFCHYHEIVVPNDPSPHTNWLTRGIEEVVAGIGFGSLVGFVAFLMWKVRIVEIFNTLFIFILSTSGMMYAKMQGFPGAASSSVIITWAIVVNTWNKENSDAANKR